MDYGKYVIINEHGIEVAICFDSLIPHNTFRYFNPIAAGFFKVVHIGKNEFAVDVWGRAVTLGDLTTRDQDNALILRVVKGRRY